MKRTKHEQRLETVAEYLARGGTITYAAPWTSGLDYLENGEEIPPHQQWCMGNIAAIDRWQRRRAEAA